MVPTWTCYTIDVLLIVTILSPSPAVLQQSPVPIGLKQHGFNMASWEDQLAALAKKHSSGSEGCEVEKEDVAADTVLPEAQLPGMASEEDETRGATKPDVSFEKPESWLALGQSLPQEGDTLAFCRQCPFLQVLTPQSRGRTLPVQCRICKKQRGETVVIDIVSRTKFKWLRQHLLSGRHLQRVKCIIAEEAKQSETTEIGGSCPGFLIFKEHSEERNPRPLGRLFHEASMYMMLHAGFLTDGHEYTLSTKGSHHAIIRHQACTRSAAQNGSECENCASLGCNRSLIRNIARCAWKMWAARMLRCKMWKMDSEEVLLREIKARRSKIIEK